MTCIEDIPHEIIRSSISFQECRRLIEENAPLVYYINPGFKILGSPLVGSPPVAIGVDGDALYFPYTKPCHGTFLLKVENREEVSRISRISRLVRRRKPEMPGLS